MSLTYGECEECGYEAETFEDARVHVRDKHGGVQRLEPYFPTNKGDD